MLNEAPRGNACTLDENSPLNRRSDRRKMLGFFGVCTIISIECHITSQTLSTDGRGVSDGLPALMRRSLSNMRATEAAVDEPDEAGGMKTGMAA